MQTPLETLEKVFVKFKDSIRSEMGDVGDDDLKNLFDSIMVSNFARLGGEVEPPLLGSERLTPIEAKARIETKHGANSKVLDTLIEEY